MKQFSLVSVAVIAVVLCVAYVLFSFNHKVEDWQEVQRKESVVVKPVTVEIDKSGIQ